MVGTALLHRVMPATRDGGQLRSPSCIASEPQGINRLGAVILRHACAGETRGPWSVEAGECVIKLIVVRRGGEPVAVQVRLTGVKPGERSFHDRIVTTDGNGFDDETIEDSVKEDLASYSWGDTILSLWTMASHAVGSENF